MSRLTEQQRRSLANHYFRKAQHAAGRSFPDGRNDEQRALGVELKWRRHVLQNEQRRNKAARDARIQAARQAAIQRWHQSSNVTSIEVARR